MRQFFTFILVGLVSMALQAQSESDTHNIGAESLSAETTSAKCTLTVTTKLPKAIISLNGKTVGTGEWSGKLQAGQYHVDVSLEGYEPYSITIDLFEGENRSINIPYLDQKYSTLNVFFYPYESEVKIDGKVVGTTLLVLKNYLHAGTHTIEISADNYEPFIGEISANDNHAVTVRGELKPIPGTVAEGIEYWEDNQYKKAYRIFSEFAKKGDATGQLYLGLCYEMGHGVDCSYIDAVMWYRKSADQGNGRAMHNLAWCYYSGKGVAQSYSEAAWWMQKGAENECVDAQCYLGDYYWHGVGVQKDEKEAVRWWRICAAKGISYAIKNLKERGYSVQEYE